MLPNPRKLLSIVALVALTGCPYTEGCDAADAAANDGTNGGGGDGADGGGDGADPTGVVAVTLDFGAPLTGGPHVSTLTCPTLPMPVLPPPPAKLPIYVNAAGAGPEDGSKGAPYRSLTKAFQAVGLKGVILVAAGTYIETNVVPDKDLTMLGGYTPDFTARTDACATVLEAADPLQPVLTGDATIRGFTMEGFTVQKGSCGLTITSAAEVDTNFTVARSVFTKNGSKTQFGGGLALNFVSVHLFQTVIKDNIGFKGAGAFVKGPKVTIDQNLFEHNLGYSDHGGGLYLVPGSDVPAKVTRNTFRGNATGVDLPPDIYGAWGGGALVDGEGTDGGPTKKAEFSYNVFTENTAGIGGGIFLDEAGQLTLSHELFYLNRGYVEGTATAGFVHGPAIYVDGTGDHVGSTLIAEYVTIVNNFYDANGQPFDTARMYGGNIHLEEGSKATVKNSIFFGNGANAFYIDGDSQINISYTLGATKCTSSNAEGFIPAPPERCVIGPGVFEPAEVSFADPATFDFHEKSAAGRFFNGTFVKDTVTSPAIDKADPAESVGDEPMPNGARANLGAFAQTTEASKSP